MIISLTFDMALNRLTDDTVLAHLAVVSSPNDAIVGVKFTTGTIPCQNLDPDDVTCLTDTISLAGNGSGHVSSVTISVTWNFTRSIIKGL